MVINDAIIGYMLLAIPLKSFCARLGLATGACLAPIAVSLPVDNVSWDNAALDPAALNAAH